MKILMITPYLPYPLTSGGQIRSYNLIKNLSKKHKIILFSFIRSDEERKYIKHLKEFCADVKVFLKRPPWSLTSLFLSVVTVYPLVVCLYLKNSLKKEIETEIKKNEIDIIHAETFYVMPNIGKVQIPIILVEQTIEFLVYQHYTETVKISPLRWLMNFDVMKIKYWERRFWQKASRVVAMSDADRQAMQTLIPNLAVNLVPNGVDNEFFLLKDHLPGKRKTILFVGNFKWLQNREAVSILVNKIWPYIKKRLRNTTLWIVGKFPTPEIAKYASDSIKVSSDIADIKDAYNKSDMLLAPINGPGGTRYKILESMASGLPVVTTPTGIEGLGAVDGKHALIGTTPSGLANQTIKILTDNVLYKTLVRNGRNLVVKQFNWQSITDKLDKIYQEAYYGQN